jgi:hypothetical protein
MQNHASRLARPGASTRFVQTPRRATNPEIDYFVRHWIALSRQLIRPDKTAGSIRLNMYTWRWVSAVRSASLFALSKTLTRSAARGRRARSTRLNTRVLGW